MKYKREDIEFVEKPTKSTFIDLTGQTFSKLTVLGFAGRLGKDGSDRLNSYWWCECSCPEENIVRPNTSHLKLSQTVSCGCTNIETQTKRFTTHGMTYSFEYNSYRSAKKRCQNPEDPSYPNYGARGIEFRFNSFEEFFDEIGERPEPKEDFSIERIDVNGHYECGNLCWATNKEQNRNMRSNHWLTLNGETKCLTDWSLLINFSIGTLEKRLKLGWCDYCTLTIGIHEGTCIHKNK